MDNHKEPLAFQCIFKIAFRGHSLLVASFCDCQLYAADLYFGDDASLATSLALLCCEVVIFPGTWIQGCLPILQCKRVTMADGPLTG